jgi:hypothetical protein
MPPFDENGNLPKGIYEVIWSDFEDRFAFNGHRKQLLTGLKQALLLLAKVGCRRVYIGGSFITNKEYPNDFDGCFDDFCIDYGTIDEIFDDYKAQKSKFGGVLINNGAFHGFFQTDRYTNPRGIVAIDPNELIEKTH